MLAERVSRTGDSAKSTITGRHPNIITIFNWERILSLSIRTIFPAISTGFIHKKRIIYLAIVSNNGIIINTIVSELPPHSKEPEDRGTGKSFHREQPKFFFAVCPARQKAGSA